MEAAQQVEPQHAENSGAQEATGGAAQDVQPTGGQAGGAGSHQEETQRHLSAVPTAPQEQRQAEPTRVLRRAQPKAEGAASDAREERPARSSAEAADAEDGPSSDQVRRYRGRWNKAKTTKERAEALRYGAERGVPEALELMRLLKADAAPKQEAHAQGGTTEPTAAAPAQGAQPQAAAPTTPEEPRYMGQARTSLQRHADAGAFIGNLVVGIGKLVEWTAPPEPMELFGGIPGFEPIKTEGKPEKRIAELVTLELSSAASKGGSEDSPTRRRLELGLLIACTAGPGLLPFGLKLASAATEKIAQLGGVVAHVVRRVRRR